jgi:aconitate hydratase
LTEQAEIFMSNSFGARTTLDVGGRQYEYFSLAALERGGLQVNRLPYSLRILLENLLRHEDGVTVTADDIRALAGWDPAAAQAREIAFARAAARLHRRSGDRRSGGDA